MKHCLYVVLCCIGISVVLCGIYSLSSAGAEFVEKFQRNNAVNAKANVVSNESLPQSFDEVLFTGDVMIARHVEKLSTVYGGDYPYAKLSSIATKTALVGNFESSIPRVHVPTPGGTFAFSVDIQFLKFLKKYGFDYVSIANNHSYDYGEDSFKHTQLSLTNAGLLPFGDQKNQGSSTIEFLSIEDSVVSLIGMHAVYTRPTRAELNMLLTRAKEQSDVQIVSIHWGDEYVNVHNAFQEKLAHDLIDLGADVIIGHHPHVVQDIELYRGVPIFYSLGNFIFDQYFSTDVQQGLTVLYSTDGAKNTFELKPVTSIDNKSQPREMVHKERSKFFSNLSLRSDPVLSTMLQKGVIELHK